MKTVVIAFFVACAVGYGLAQDCSAKIQAFHQCVEDSHKKDKEDFKAKFADLKTKLDACYTSNGCTPPAAPQKGAKGAGEHRGSGDGAACGKAIKDALKGKFEDCIKKAVPGFSLPQKDGQHGKREGGEHRGWDHKGDNKALEGCAKKQEVRDCKRALFEANKPTEAQKEAKFKAGCDAKQQCSVALGADCQAQLAKFKQAACQCRQQLKQEAEQARTSAPACSNVPAKSGQHERKQESCEQKDYCKLGYQAFVADHPHGKEGDHH